MFSACIFADFEWLALSVFEPLLHLPQFAAMLQKLQE
jgi:hypothetical protein